MSELRRFTVALVGFSAFETAAIGSFFRLAASRTPTYVQVATPDDSDFVIADADHAQAIDELLASGRTADTVFIGALAPADAMARLTRPIDPRHIVRELDSLVLLRTQGLRSRVAGSGEVAGDVVGHVASDVVSDTVSNTVSDAVSDAARPDPAHPGAAAPLPAAGLLSAAAVRLASAGGAGRDVLVVEDSAIAAKFLCQRLMQLNYRVHVATNGEAAIELVSHQPFALAFIDVLLGPPGSIDGLRVCQYIKQRTGPSRVMTAVVMVTGLGGASDRVRGSLAGCDAYLVKPLLEAEFMQTLRSVDRAFAWAPAAKA